MSRSVAITWALATVVLVAGCGRLGFDELGDGGSSTLEIVAVQPSWAMPAGGPVRVELGGDTDGVIVAIDGIECAQATATSPRVVECTAPAHAPGSVDVTATNASGASARHAKPFAYLTPGMYQLGGPLDDRTSGIAVDADGNVYVSGGTMGDLDGPNAGDFDALLIKYDASGTLAWVRQLGTPLFDYARDVAVDRSGDVTIVGWGTGDIDASGSTSGGNDIFVARYSPDGTLRWVTQTGTSGDDQAWDLAVDDAGAVAVAAHTTGAFPGHANVGGIDYVVLRYGPDGALAWLRQDGSVADDDGHSIAIGPDGAAFLVGYTRGALTPGAANAGGLDMYAARYETDGTRTWIRQRGSAADDEATDVTVDADGEVWIAGFTAGTLDGNPNAGGDDVFVMRFGASGTWRFTRVHGSVGTENGWGVGVAPGGPVYLSCVTTGAFDGQTYAGGSNDFCMIAMDRDGNHLWTRITGTSGYDGSSSCAVDAARTGMVYISLITDRSLDGAANRGGQDVAVAKLDAAGDLR